MVVGVQGGKVTTPASQKLQRPVCQHLVGVHVVGCPGAGLKRIDHELISQFTGQNFIGSGCDGVADLLIQPAGGHVGSGSALLDDYRGPDKGRVRLQARNREIMHGPGGLRPVVGLGRHFHFAHAVFFNACGHGSPRLFRSLQRQGRLALRVSRTTQKLFSGPSTLPGSA